MDEQLRRRSVGAPAARSLLLTVLGEYVLPRAGSVWQETLVGALQCGRHLPHEVFQPAQLEALRAQELAERAAGKEFHDDAPGMFFDEEDMLYLNTTTASHERLKYSRQIDLSQKDVSVVLKLDKMLPLSACVAA